jgi:hypothetical protein
MSWYLTVRRDPSYSRYAAVGPLLEHLQTLPELVQTGPQEFRNAPGLPWVCLCLAKADAAGCYAIGDTQSPTVNVVELVCGDGDELWYESLAQRVATFLHWEAVDEHGRRTVYPRG